MEAVDLIKSGEVTLNGRVVRNPSVRVAMDVDKIEVNRLPLQPTQCIYILMNKPVGVITTRSDERGRKTVYDILGDVGSWVFPVGRLDKDTSGLLLFTNDNQLGERLTNPSSKIPKRYVVHLHKPFLLPDQKIMEKGMRIGDEKLLPARIKRLADGIIEMTIVEGKNRQVRRMCEALGYEVLQLTRTGIGSLTLGTMKPGEWVRIRKEQISHLFPTDTRKIAARKDRHR